MNGYTTRDVADALTSLFSCAIGNTSIDVYLEKEDTLRQKHILLYLPLNSNTVIDAHGMMLVYGEVNDFPASMGNNASIKEDSECKNL